MPFKSAPPSDQLRRGEDRGRQGDKDDFWDPVAPPFGEDEDAAGRSPFATEREPAFRKEPDPESVPDVGGLLGRNTPFPLILLLALAFFAILAICWSLWGR